jgi:hypothetical protein
VPHIAWAVERYSRLELAQEPHQLLRKDRDGSLISRLVLVRVVDLKAILRMKITSPENVIAKRLEQKALENVRIFPFGT